MRIVYTLLFLLTGVAVSAQQFNNEWIDFSKTYYKIKLGKSGLHRIPQSTLAAAGFTNVEADKLELYRNGQLVPYFPSVPTGPIPADGYIEFWATMNDGTADKALYTDPAFQHSTVFSMFTDTTVYFLTTGTGPSAGAYRIEEATNDVTNPTQAAEPWFMHTAGLWFRQRANAGKASVMPEYIYLSDFDRGEFPSSNEILPATNFSNSLSNLFVNPAGPDATFSFGAAGNALNARTVRVLLNNQVVAEPTMDFFNDVNTSVTIPSSTLPQSTIPIRVVNTSAVSTDRMVVTYFTLQYPRNFNFGGSNNFALTLPPKQDGYYLRITNYNNQGVVPVLYDLTNRKRYKAVASGTEFRFVLPPSALERKLLLVSQATANINTVNTVETRQFLDYRNPGAVDDSLYMIITHPILYAGSSGNNPVADYAAYRESVPGGSHKVLITEIGDLNDQFGFGIKFHPLAIRNFLRYARANFRKPPSNVFIIGRGVTYWDRFYGGGATANNDRINLIQTWGHPGADNLLSAEDNSTPIVQTPIGRLSVVYGREIEDYLEKVKEYESAQQQLPATTAAREWMKNVVHVTGSSEPHLGSVLCNYMGVYKQIIQDTLFGGVVTTFCKESTNSVEQLTATRLTELFNEGISLLTYFGHSSATTLEFNISSPSSYDNRGKYPVFCVNGCNAGNFFTNYAPRLQANETLSEKFVLAKQRGAIAFLASTGLGVVSYLHLYLNNLYSELARKDYGKTLGQLNRDALRDMYIATGGGDFYARMHAAQISIHGDPVLKLNAQPKPDYVMEESLIKIAPNFISVAESQFQVKIRVVNLGRANSDSVLVQVKRQYPDGTIAMVYNKKIKGIRSVDSLAIEVPIVATRDKGLNKITVTLDPLSAIDEMVETNNSATKEFFVYEEEARPSYPYNFSIVHDQATKFYATTANPFSTQRNYIMELDTTEAFNSPLKVAKTISSPGGLLEFTPGLAFLDSTVYYWRVTGVPPAGGDYKWNYSSFTFIAGQQITGFGQGHYFQHLKSTSERVTLQGDRKWNYGERTNTIGVRGGVWPNVGNGDNPYSVAINNDNYIKSACIGNSIVFIVIDPVTFKPWKNVNNNNVSLFLYGSAQADCKIATYHNFEYSYTTAASRKKAMDFMDAVPNGFYVVARNMDAPAPQSFAATVWRADTTLYGSNNSLYHKLLQAGFTKIDSMYKRRSWGLIYKKNDPSFIPRDVVSVNENDASTLDVVCLSKDTVGYIESPKFGPAKGWKSIKWRGTSQESPSHDWVTIDVIGINNANQATHLFILDNNNQDFDISSVNAAQYPFMQLRMRNVDSITVTPFQLRYWNVLYDEVPEGVLAPNIAFQTKDTLEIGEPLKFRIPFKNISQLPFDSVLVKLDVIDRNNVRNRIAVPKLKPIISGDTALITFDIDTKTFPENNTINLDVNPDFHQPEQYHYNNFLFRNFFVKQDNTNPLLDVTFDGVHIINGDLVSAKPHIQIRLKDEAKYMLLNDTTITSVQVKFPNGDTRDYYFDNDTLRFTPASSGVDNSAVLDFFPVLTNASPEGDEYELTIKAEDKSGNKSGTMDYRISFKVISKPMISNLLNYPNPFSTSTAFVFTLTGSEIPQNIKIQILTVTGKIVREITKDELGPIHIGRNITEFKWNGTDQYGGKLGNGVYLYRVVTTLNGGPMEKYRSEGDDTDKYFRNGYGKMYLMR